MLTGLRNRGQGGLRKNCSKQWLLTLQQDWFAGLTTLEPAECHTQGSSSCLHCLLPQKESVPGLGLVKRERHGGCLVPRSEFSGMLTSHPGVGLSSRFVSVSDSSTQILASVHPGRQWGLLKVHRSLIAHGKCFLAAGFGLTWPCLLWTAGE